MKLFVAGVLASAALMGTAGALSGSGHTEQRPSTSSVVGAPTQAEVTARTIRDARALDGGSALVPCDPLTDQYRCVFVR